MAKEQDIGLRNGNIKRLCMFIISSYCFLIVIPQNICISHSNYQFDIKDVTHVCGNFLENYSRKNDSMNKLLVDYEHTDSIEIYTVTEYFEISDLHCKKPDAYLYFKNQLLLIYTKDYALEKDTIWYHKILSELIFYFWGKSEVVGTLLSSISPKQKIWIGPKIVNIPGNIHFNIIRYEIKNGMIKNIKKTFKTLYECKNKESPYSRPCGYIEQVNKIILP